jgi:hypothetical protein
MKKVICILLGLVVVVLLAVVAVVFFLDSLVKKGVETAGPRVTKVEVKLDSASVSLLSGSGALKGLLVANPPGFTSPSAIKAGEISLGVEPRSLLADKVVVHSIHVRGPEITLDGPTGANLRRIIDNVRASRGTAPAGSGTSKQDNSGGKKIQVDDFLITGGKISVVLPVVGATTLPLPEIHLTDLGRGSNGLTPAELAERILEPVLQHAVAQAANAGSKEAGKQVEKVTKGLGTFLK